MGVMTRNMWRCLQKYNKLNKSHLVGQLLNTNFLLLPVFEPRIFQEVNLNIAIYENNEIKIIITAIITLFYITKHLVILQNISQKNTK